MGRAWTDFKERFPEFPFKTAEACFAFYREALPKRCPVDFGEEIGPVFQQQRPDLGELYARDVFALGENPVDMSAGLDWTRAEDGDYEWTCALARHHHLPVLARAGKPEWDKAALRHMLNWIENVPMPEGDKQARQCFTGPEYLRIKRGNWRPLEIAFRVGETWPSALRYLVNSEIMTAAAWEQIARSLYAQAKYLREYRWRVGNHSIMEAAAIVNYQVMFREFPETEKWRDECVKYLEDSIDDMFFPDTYSREMSGGYRWTMVKGYFALYQVAALNRSFATLSPNFKARIEQVAEAEFYHLKPDLSVPVTNESNSGARREKQLRDVARYLSSPRLDYILSNGKRGVPPEFSSFFYRDANIAIMRSGWSPDALYLFFDAGPVGKHVIGDQLCVEVSAYGQTFLVNCGRWRYTTSPNDNRWMDWAKYFKSSASCNTVIPEGFTQTEADAKGEMTISAELDEAKGVYEGEYEKDGVKTRLTHIREIVFVKPFFWVVRDTLLGELPSPMEQLWHFSPGCRVEIDYAAGLARTITANANLIVMPLTDNVVDMTLYHGSEAPKRGWHCPEYAKKVPAFELVCRSTGNEMVTLLLPVKGEAETLVKKGRKQIVREIMERAKPILSRRKDGAALTVALADYANNDKPAAMTAMPANSP